MAWRSTQTHKKRKGVLIACLGNSATNQTHRIVLSVSDNERRFSPNSQRSPQKEKKKMRYHANNNKKKRLNKKSATSRTSKQRVGRCSWLSDTRIKGAGLMTPSIWALRKKKAFLKKRVSVHKSGYKTYFANSVLEKNERSQMTAWCSDPKKPKYFFFFFTEGVK